MIYFDCFLAVIVFFYLLDPFMTVVSGKTTSLPLAGLIWTLFVTAGVASYLMGKYLPLVLQ